MNVYYAKTALYAYPNIQAVADQIDELVEKRALSSMTDFTSVVNQCEKILDLTAQKDGLFALKLHIEDVLKQLDAEQLDCIEYRYFKRKPKEYFEGFDFDSRTYFRKQAKLAIKVAKQLENNGATDKWFEENCLVMDFFKELYKRTIEHEKSYSRKKSCKTYKVEKINMSAKLSA